MDSGTAELKAHARQIVDRHLPQLCALSHDLHDHPELAFEEHHAVDAVTALLPPDAFDLRHPVAGLETAFVASAGSGNLRIALCAEYDALPGVGHACGHNIIAASALGAALVLAELAPLIDASVVLLGTPAEEGGGGKILLLDAGAFGDAHLALMVHPWPTDRLLARALAVEHFDVTYTGREAHASAAPADGINALDALTIAQVAIGLLRQSLHPADQVHGFVSDGGRMANIIPASASGRFMMRAADLDALDLLRPRVRACFEAGALATGATVLFDVLAPVYSHMLADADLLAAYRANAVAVGRTFAHDDAADPLPTFSTDMANVSLAIPSIHPLLGLETGGAVNHHPDFAAATLGPSADLAVADGAYLLAATAIDAASTPALRDRLLQRRRADIDPAAPSPKEPHQ